jgi:origin recognition complex subunit 5
VAICKEALEQADYGPFDGIDGRCESLAALAVQVSQLLEHCPRFYLVFDGVDNQREAPPTLLPALTRLGDLVPNLFSDSILAANESRSLD